jgi:hypothetical protein
MKCTILIIVLAIAIGATVLLAGEGVARQDPGGIAFREVVTSEPLLYPASLSAGELSRDGVPGLAVVSADNTASLAYALGGGNGRFGAWREDQNDDFSPGFVLLADVYGNGNLDAISTEEGGNEIDIAAGDGKGHLYDMGAVHSSHRQSLIAGLPRSGDASGRNLQRLLGHQSLRPHHRFL